MKKVEKKKLQTIEEMIGEIGEVISDASLRHAAAERMAEKGYVKRAMGEWELDTTYKGKTKQIYLCSVCGHWQSGKKKDKGRFHMNYCPFCGAEMWKNKSRENALEEKNDA